jgi:hypothetical protein
MKLEFSRQFSKNPQISDFMKISPVGAELFHTDGRTDGQRTDMTKVLVTSRNFANAPNKMETCHLGYAVSEIWWDDHKIATRARARAHTHTHTHTYIYIYIYTGGCLQT